MQQDAVCTPWHWRLERVEGRPARYLITLTCMHGHLHHAAVLPSYREARAEMRRWIADTYWPDYPHVMIADAACGRLILSGGRELPLATEATRHD